MYTLEWSSTPEEERRLKDNMAPVEEGYFLEASEARTQAQRLVSLALPHCLD